MTLHVRMAKRGHLMVNWVLWRLYPLPAMSEPRKYRRRRASLAWRLNDWLARPWIAWWLEHRRD
jgi:hypothetical protein